MVNPALGAGTGAGAAGAGAAGATFVLTYKLVQLEALVMFVGPAFSRRIVRCHIDAE